MPFDALAALRAAGNPVDSLSEAQREVFASLTEEEVDVLNSIKRRLDALEEEDVSAHVTKIL
jgi:hypothetical protein